MNNIEAERVRKCFTKELSVETLVRISEALGVTAEYLLNDTINMPSDKIMVLISQSLALSMMTKSCFSQSYKKYRNIER